MRKAALGAVLIGAGMCAATPTRMPAQAAKPSDAQTPATTSAQPKSQRSDVRQIVTFQFLPGMTDSATAVYRRELLPAYVADTAMRRFRAYSEAESPEPLDLIVISHFDGMAGMDASNVALRTMSSNGRSVFQWYGVLSAITQRHHDQFVEMLPSLCLLGTGPGDGAKRQTSESGSAPRLRAQDQTIASGAKSRAATSSKSRCDALQIGADTTAPLVVIEYIRTAPNARSAFESLVASALRPIEGAAPGLQWSETGRLLISDSWDFVRFYGVISLGAWHDYQTSLRSLGATASADPIVAARKTIIVRRQRALAVR